MVQMGVWKLQFQRVSCVAFTVLNRHDSRKNKAMRKTSKKTTGADEIAEKATRGENVSGYFTNRVCAPGGRCTESTLT